jgi:hypothetical protein
MTNILIGTPCYNGWVATDYFVSMLGLQQELNRQGIDFALEMTTSQSLIPVARNFIASKVLAQPWFTHLLFIDADLGFDPTIVPRYVAANRDVVAGIYPIKQLNLDTIRRLPPGAPVESTLHYAVAIDEGQQTTTDGFVKAVYAATGFMLVKREVLEKMAAAHPELKYQDSFTHVSGPPAVGGDHLYALFDTSIDPIQRKYLPEDYTFCNRWRAMGGEIWVDIYSKFTHIGQYPFHGDFSVFARPS